MKIGKLFICIAAAVSLCVSVARAEQAKGFLYTEEDIPDEMVSASIVGKKTRVDSLAFLCDRGKSNLSRNQLATFDQFVSNSVGKVLFFKGVADTTRFKNSIFQKDPYRENLLLAEARADWALRRAERGRKSRHPGIDGNRPCVIVYAVTYTEAPADSSSPSTEGTKINLDLQVKMEEAKGEKSNPPPSLSPPFPADERTSNLLCAAGFSAIAAASGSRLYVPTISVGLIRDRLEIWATGGWRPKSAQGDIFGPRAQTTISLDVRFFPRTKKLGLSGGILAGWEIVRSSSQFINQVYGGKFGIVSRLFQRKKIFLDLEAEGLVINANVLSRTGDWWTIGPTAAIHFGLKF